jgi:hypothetical protein
MSGSEQKQSVSWVYESRLIKVLSTGVLSVGEFRYRKFSLKSKSSQLLLCSKLGVLVVAWPTALFA